MSEKGTLKITVEKAILTRDTEAIGKMVIQKN